MPSSLRSETWDVRVDALEGVEENLRTWCERYGAVLCVKEWADDESSNPHFHIALRTKMVSDQSVRDWVKKLLPPANPPDSKKVKIWDGEEKFLRYCCKGPDWHAVKTGKKSSDGDLSPPIVIFTTLSPGTIGDLHCEFWNENRKQTEAIRERRKDNEQKSMSVNDIIRDTVAHMKEYASKNHMTYERGAYVAFSYIFDHYKGKITKYHLQPMVQSAIYQYSNQFQNQLKKAMFSDIYRSLDGPGYMAPMECSNNLYEDLISHQ